MDVSGVAIEGHSTRRLNRPAQAQVKIPMDAAIGGPGSLLKIYFDGWFHHHGRILNCETDTGEDTGYTVYNSEDAMELWRWRPVRDADGDFSKPDIITDFTTGPQIVEEMLANSETYEGDLYLSFGGFEGSGVDLSGAPTDWPMTMAQLASLLISTGELDIVITPIDSGGDIGQVDCYNGDYGTDLSGSVVFQYGTGAHNISRLRWNEDMSNMCNKLWYYGGPRIATPADPAGDQHWCWNITADDPDLADPPLSTILAARTSSQSTYGVRMDIKIFDALSDLCLGQGGFDPERWLYRRLWLIESWLRLQPREIIHITPAPGTGIGSFDIGDLIGVEASSAVRGGFSGAQRVYEYTVSWNEDGPFSLSELQTSPNNEGI